MSSQARNFRVGAFVLSGIGLILLFLVTLGGTSLFSSSYKFETYFDESVAGLEIGSPVRMRGVQVGRVASIAFANEVYEVPSREEARWSRLVVVDIETRGEGEDSPEEWEQTDRFVQSLVVEGLRFRLNSSPITGITYIEADFTSPTDHPLIVPPWEPRYRYIPSSPSVLRALFDRIEDIDIEAVLTNFNALVVQLRHSAVDLDTAGLKREVSALVGELRGTNTRAQRILDGNRYELELAIENLRVASENIRDLTETARQYPSYLLLGEPPERTKGMKQ